MQALKRARGGPSDELAVIAQRAQAFTNASGTAIALSEGNAGEIICRARAGASAPDVGTALRVEGTFTGLCIQSGQELCCDDAETDGRVDKAAIRALGIRSMVVIPIKEQGRVVGVLAAFAPTAHAFRITHVAVLKTLAGHIAAYLEGKQRGQASSLEPSPAPAVKAAAVSPGSPAMPSPAVVFRPAAPATTLLRRPVVPKAAPLRASRLAEDELDGSVDGGPQTAPVLRGLRTLDQAPVGEKKKTSSHDEHKEPKTGFLPAVGILDAAVAPRNKPSATVLVIGAAAVVAIAVAVGLSLKLRRPPAAPPPAVETSTLPATPPPPAPFSADVAQRKPEKAQPKREETIVLLVRPSRIPAARDNSPSASDAPSFSLGSVPASGSLSNLAGAVSASTPSILRTQSALEPLLVIREVPPVYPLVAKERRLSGSVVVQGTVDKNGRIRDLQLISGPPLFRNAAFEAVKQWVFKPARLNGLAIEQSTKIRLDFRPQ